MITEKILKYEADFLAYDKKYKNLWLKLQITEINNKFFVAVSGNEEKESCGVANTNYYEEFNNWKDLKDLLEINNYRSPEIFHARVYSIVPIKNKAGQIYVCKHFRHAPLIGKIRTNLYTNEALIFQSKNRVILNLEENELSEIIDVDKLVKFSSEIAQALKVKISKELTWDITKFEDKKQNFLL